MFVIQTENNQICTDMGLSLYRAADFLKWLGRENFRFRLQEDNSLIDRDDIPVGTLEWTEEVSGHQTVVTNVPEYLWGSAFVQRKLGKGNREDLRKALQKGMLFVKSDTKNHGFEANVFSAIEQVPEDSRYFWSEPVNFQAEWRVFVSHGKILDVRQYAGSWEQSLKNAEIELIKKFVQTANLPYSAYTADFGRTGNGLELVEIHNFISCGLYGFEDLSRIRLMIQQAWREDF